MTASDIEVNDLYNEAQKEANPDSYVTIEFDTLDPADSSKCPVRLTTEKLPDGQKTVQQLAYEKKQSLVDGYDGLSDFNMTAKVQWDPLKQLLFLGETYLMYHHRATTYLNGSVRSDMEYWSLYRVKEDRRITFSFGDEYGESRLKDYLSLFAALEGNPPTVYVEDSVTLYDYDYNSEFHQPAVIMMPDGASVINDTLYKDLDRYSGYDGDIYNVTYDWSVVNGMISICVCADSVYASYPDYLVYNYSVSGDGTTLSDGDFIENLGLSWEEYRQQLTEALERSFYELYGEFANDASFEEKLAFTLSESNLGKAVPFYTAADGLCVAVPVGSLVGADCYERTVPLSKNESAPVEESSADSGGSREDAIQIFWTVSSSNWNGYNMASLTEIVFNSYDIQCNSYQGSGTQYLVTLSGEYCPNVVDLPYITETGSLTLLIDTSTGEAVLMEDSGIIEAFEVYIALGTDWYSGW